MITGRELSPPRGRPRVNFDVKTRRPPRIQRSPGDITTRGPLAEEMYQFRTWCGWTKERFAELLLVSPKAIYYWEFGIHEPTRIVWASFVRVRKNYRQKLKKAGVDWDGGPLMESFDR
jgi:hypothetical protein